MHDTSNRIPVKRDGGLWFTVPYPNRKNLVWEAPSEFEAELQLVAFQITPKGNFYLWSDVDSNATYPMIPEEFSEVPCELPQTVDDTVTSVNGAWTFIRKGDRYSLRFLEEV